jgi:protoporphyrinogen oxidase
MNNQTVILGGGVAGCMAAKALAPHGPVVLVEATPRLGGLMQDVEFGGFRFDIGVFLFSEEHPMFRAFPGTRELCVQVVHNNQVLTPADDIAGYPFSMRNFIGSNGLSKSAGAAANLLWHKIRSRRRHNFPEWARYYLGNALYEQSGFRHYVERLYCLPHTEIGLKFALYRLAMIETECSLRKNFFGIARKFIRRTEGVYHYPCYVRPAGGFGVLFGEIARQLTAAGVQIITGNNHLSVSADGAGHIVSTDAGEIVCKRVISTIPVTAAADALGISAGEFPTMTLKTLCYELDGEPNFTSPTLYNFTFAEQWKRLTLFSRFYPGKEQHYFGVECTMPEDSDIPTYDLRAGFERHTAEHAVFRGSIRFLGVKITRNAYPLYKTGYEQQQEYVKQQIAARGITLAGRQGDFAYLTSGEVAQRAEALAPAAAGQ